MLLQFFVPYFNLGLVRGTREVPSISMKSFFVNLNKIGEGSNLLELLFSITNLTSDNLNPW